MKDKTIGFYLTLVAAVLSLIGAVLYPQVMYQLPVVYICCIAAVVLAVIVTVLSLKGGAKPIFGYLPTVNAILMACAAVWAVYLMVNQIGYVVSELDDKSTIMGLIYFEIAAVLSMIINIVSSFFKQEKAE